MNKLTIIGNLTKDPERRTTQQGSFACSFTVAVNRKKRMGTDYFRVTAWDKLGELCAEALKVGSKVAVYGRVSISTFTGNDGKQYSTMNVIAEEVEFLSPRDEKTGPKQENPVQQDATEVVDDENLPF